MLGTVRGWGKYFVTIKKKTITYFGFVCFGWNPGSSQKGLVSSPAQDEYSCPSNKFCSCPTLAASPLRPADSVEALRGQDVSFCHWRQQSGSKHLSLCSSLLFLYSFRRLSNAIRPHFLHAIFLREAKKSAGA